MRVSLYMLSRPRTVLVVSEDDSVPVGEGSSSTYLFVAFLTMGEPLNGVILLVALGIVVVEMKSRLAMIGSWSTGEKG